MTGRFVGTVARIVAWEFATMLDDGTKLVTITGGKAVWTTISIGHAVSAARCCEGSVRDGAEGPRTGRAAGVKGRGGFGCNGWLPLHQTHATAKKANAARSHVNTGVVLPALGDALARILISVSGGDFFPSCLFRGSHRHPLNKVVGPTRRWI